ncbi:MAG: DUF378 domain-containing protein [Candidatus Paceibacterota bacterium]
MKKLSAIDWVALILVIIGGLNWGLVGLFEFNLVTSIFGENIVSRIIFVIVGLSALYLAIGAGSFSKKEVVSHEQA